MWPSGRCPCLWQGWIVTGCSLRSLQILSLLWFYGLIYSCACISLPVKYLWVGETLQGFSQIKAGG